MRLTIIYPNTLESRTAIFSKIPEWSKKADLTKGINAAHFKIIQGWPSFNELQGFPLSLQVEEIELENDTITSLRKLVNDVEIISNIQEEKPVIFEEGVKEPIEQIEQKEPIKQ
jgi:hypothetical protein